MKQREFTFRAVLFIGVLWLCCSASGQLRISEFMAANTRTLADENNSYEDWIEIQNTSATNVNLLNWSLTDEADDLAKWRFPATNIPPGGYMVVFASNKNRRVPGARLHTNFKLGAEGEFLALVDPTGTNILSRFDPFPQQLADVSYGFGLRPETLPLVTNGAPAQFLVPSEVNNGNKLHYAWTGAETNEPFDLSTWLPAQTAIGFTSGTDGIGTNEFNTDIGSWMLNSNASVFLRVPFVVDDPANYTLMTLNIAFNDGYAAWINGIQVAGENIDPATLDWNSTATAEYIGAPTASVPIGNAGIVLRPGTNILALQGLNVASTNSSFLLAPQLSGTTVPQESAQAFYFRTPTPGIENVIGSAALGPGIADVAHTPNVPGNDDDVIVTARVFATLSAVSNVVLRYRIMFGGEVSVPMFDDGAHNDGAAGDGVFGATIPAGASVPGQMIRYYVQAEDAAAKTSRWPIYSNPIGSAQYLGTVVKPNVTSKLPIFELFIGNPTAADSESGTRASFFHDGEFYDNIGIEVRGNTTATWNKKSHRLEFNKEHRLRHPGPGPRIEKTSLMAEFGDPSYLRHHLSFWMQELAGVPAPFHYPVHLRLNGAFWQLAFHNDVLGDEQMERLGYDPEGSLYKAAGSIQTSHYSLGRFQKLLPKTNGVLYASTADFDAMASAISESRPAGQRRTNIFEHLNVPEVINYLAVARFCHEGDDVWANMSVQRDTYGSGEWSIIPFDMNASWGQLFYSDNPFQYSRINATDDYYKSHPLYGGSQIQEANGGNGRPYNRIYDAIVSVPETRQMLLRRMRTVMDTIVQPPGTPYANDIILQHITTMTNLIWDEARLDRAKWGWPPNSLMYGFGPGIWLTNGVRALIDEFIQPRRQHFFYTHCVVNSGIPVGLAYYLNAGIPTEQPPAAIDIAGFDYNPASGNQDQEYVRLSNTNSFAVDISGWQLKGGIEFTFRGGTVMASNSVLYVSPDVKAFRSRVTTPRGGQGLFVQGNYNGRLNAWGEALELRDPAGALISSNGYPGTPSDAQRYLRITEIMYNPSPLPGNTNDAQQFEYVELKNISTNLILNLEGVRFTNGIYFHFGDGSVTSLDPQQRVLVVRNRTAFETRYGTALTIAGEFAGTFDNGSETVRLEDSVGEKILEFDYEDDWYPITDGLGFSLVVVDEYAHWSSWDSKTNWRASGTLNGAPGVADPPPGAIAPILVNEVLTHTDSPQLDSVELFNPNASAVPIGGWFLTDDFYSPRKYRIPNGTSIPAGGFLVFNENQFNSGPNGFRFSELGESVYLFSGNAASNLTGYVDGFQFGEAPRGVSFGRYANSQTNVFQVLQSATTLNQTNAYPRVGPIVVNEIMYRPPDLNLQDNDLDEFIELQNITATNVALHDPLFPANTWRLRNAVDFDFPTNRFLAAGQRLLVVGFDPTNALQLAAFKTKFGVSNDVPIYGPWSGKLDNSGETIELKQPEEPDVSGTNVIVPYIMIDKVAYRDSAPWPAAADGIGNSLQRLSRTGFGNDPTNWFAAGVTAGRETVPNTLPVATILSPASGELYEFGASVVVSVQAGDPGGSIRRVELCEGNSVITHWTNNGPFNFIWNAPPAGKHRLYAIAYDNLGGIAHSDTVEIRVMDPPVLSLLSQYQQVAEGNSGTNLLWFHVVLSRPTLQTVSCRFTSSDITATAGSDYLATNGVLTFPPGQTNRQFAVGIRGDGIAENNEYFAVSLFSPTNCALGMSAAYAEISNDDISLIDHLTELFTGTNDLVSRSITFTPDGSPSFYSVCQEPATAFPTSPTGGTTVTLSDDSSVRVTLPVNETIAIYERRTNVFFIGSNGYLTVGAGDSSLSANYDTHFALPRVSALLHDLNPSTGGTISWRKVNDRVAVTYLRVPRYGAAAQTNTFQIELFFDGRIRLTYLGIKSTYTLVGLSRGEGVPPGMLPSNFIAYPSCPPPDTDGDGMPDSWEQANGTNPNLQDRDLDLDQDGLSNLQEFFAGTSPTNAASALRFNEPAVLDGNLILQFTAASNRSYTIQRRGHVESGPWENWQNILSAPTNRSIQVTNTVAPTNLLYRLVTPQQ